ncbi:MAG: lipoyl(octanoyl) transferase LipB [Candidatus Zixiibacteriota bacterium]
MSCELRIIDLGRTRYQTAWDFQKDLVRRRAESAVPDCLILTEHEPVITMGRGTDRTNLLVTADNLAARGVDLHEIERGGDITFHGPGQAVLYPIIDLRERGRDVRRYLRDLEQMVIETLADLGLVASVKEGLTGIWVENRKVGAIGVAVSKWISYHGVAINVNTDLDYFKLINPCGITQYPVGSVSQLVGREIKPAHFNELLVQHFADYFGYEAVNAPDGVRYMLDSFLETP